VPLPIVSNIRELSSAPRRFLLFTVFNVVSWHSLVGPSMVLFARKIDMPASWVGVLLACMPLSMILVMGTVPLVMRFGPKRLMVSTWFFRNIVTAAVFLLPWAIQAGGQQSGWYLLMATTLSFCIVRALGVGAWFPWLHEFVPEEQRGAYFSAETALAQIVMVGVNLFHALLLQGDPSMNRFFVIYGVGIAAGVISVALMARVPGGARPDPHDMDAREELTYRAVFADRQFMRFVIMVSLGYASMAWLGASSVLYMRDMIGLSANVIMAVMTTASLGVFLTIRFWARFADYSGPRSAVALSLVGHGVIATFFLGLWPGAVWTPWLVFPAVVMASILSAAFSAISHRAMLDYVPDHGRMAYTNVWILGTSMALGLSPVLAGFAIQTGGYRGFELCFLIAGVGGILFGLAERLLVARVAERPQPMIELFSPGQPVRALARIVWITAGLHRSNRPSRVKPRPGTPETGPAATHPD
jgi:hypothetical protein